MSNQQVVIIYYVQWGKDHLEDVKSFYKRSEAFTFADNLQNARRLRITRREDGTLTPDQMLREIW